MMRAVCGLLVLCLSLLGGCASLASPSGLDASAVADRAPYASREARDWDRYFGRYRVDLEPGVVAEVITRAIEGLEGADAISARFDEMGMRHGVYLTSPLPETPAPCVGFLVELEHRGHPLVVRDVNGYVLLDPAPGVDRVLTRNTFTGP
jgi:hypothetical protein